MEGLFKKTLNTIDDEEFINKSRKNRTDFSRNRKFSFKDLMITLMGFSRPSVKTEIDRFFKSIAKDPHSFDSISKSAFTQTRRKLRPKAFKKLSEIQLLHYINHAPRQVKWKGKRIIAIDGSYLNLPHTEELKKKFGMTKNQYDEVVGAKSSFAYDVGNELVIDSIIERRDSSEQDLALRHLSKLNPETDILVFDRGYPAAWLFALLKKKGFKFCFRMNSLWQDVAIFKNNDASNDIDWVIKNPTREARKKLKEFGLPEITDGMRLVSITLPSGEKEVLAVNLTDRQNYTIEDLKELYHLRWGVEEGYKAFKKVLHIEHFSGKTAQAIRQDYYARVCMLNMASMIKSQGLYEKTKKTKRKNQAQLNRTQVLAKTKDFLYDLFYSPQIRKCLFQIFHLLEGCFDIIRPKRSFPRPPSGRKRFKGLSSKGI